jgi:hypothetical protein
LLRNKNGGGTLILKKKNSITTQIHENYGKQIKRDIEIRP